MFAREHTPPPAPPNDTTTPVLKRSDVSQRSVGICEAKLIEEATNGAIEEKIYVEVLATDFKMVLAAHEGESRAQLIILYGYLFFFSVSDYGSEGRGFESSRARIPKKP